MKIIVILIFGAIGSAIFFFFRFGTEWMAKLKFKRNKTTPFNLAKEGTLVKLRGKARRHESIVKAPLSQEPCLCYYVFAEIPSVKFRASTVWGRDFWIECEGGGKVLVKSDNAQPYFNDSFKFNSGLFSKVPEHIEKYINRYGKSSKQGKLECRETILKEGDDVVAVGIAKWKNQNTPDEYILLKTGGNAIYVSNIPEWIDYQ